MSMSQRMDLRQTQNLIMTPQLQQAIKMLQLSNMELNELVEQEMEQNPLLDKADPPEPEANEAPAEKTEKPAEDFDAGSAMASVGSGGNSKFDNPEYNYENTIADAKSLREHLTEQMNLAINDPRDLAIGAMLIDQLDESGYVRKPPEELAALFGCKEERITKLLDVMKAFDPTGIFAQDLGECLALQLDEMGDLTESMQLLVDNLDLLANHDLAGLAKRCNVPQDELAEMIQDIRRLNPKPASDFDHFVTQTVVPDVLMKKLPAEVGGGWGVELNNITLPRVLVNQRYYTEVKKSATQKKDKEYLNDQLTAANWLVRALDQRAQTILKVASQIIEEQDAFFLYGIEFLKPMTLRDIAEEVEMHESTISRVTTNKYIGTPRGIFELKFFFSSSIAATSVGGAAHSAEAVKARIKNLIDAESVEKVLSDDAIVDLLQGDGVDIARRTVAKYRESMHIPSSVQRRRQKKNMQAQG